MPARGSFSGNPASAPAATIAGSPSAHACRNAPGGGVTSALAIRGALLLFAPRSPVPRAACRAMRGCRTYARTRRAGSGPAPSDSIGAQRQVGAAVQQVETAAARAAVPTDCSVTRTPAAAPPVSDATRHIRKYRRCWGSRCVQAKAQGGAVAARGEIDAAARASRSFTIGASAGRSRRGAAPPPAAPISTRDRRPSTDAERAAAAFRACRHGGH